jgi:uncharacterized membrane protein (UPF0127 family)
LATQKILSKILIFNHHFGYKAQTSFAMNRSRIALFLLIIFVGSSLAYVLIPMFDGRANAQESIAQSAGPASQYPVFVKEGELVFEHPNGQKIQDIDIEIASTPLEQRQGLMYRPAMADSVGMLFIFDVAEPQAFWMKNTILSLDIIYVGADKRIVSIQKNAKPYSETSLPSEGDAQYVVEVIAGYCDKHGIGKGDKVVF